MSQQLPPPDSYACFVERMRCLKQLYSASSTSGGRSERRNDRVGGNSLSKHQAEYGYMAEDIVLDDMVKTKRTACVRVANGWGMWAKDEDDHIHVQGLPPGDGRLP